MVERTQLSQEGGGVEQLFESSGSFGELLRALRARRSITQDTLGSHVGIHPSTISRFERGDDIPNIRQTVLLADELWVSRFGMLEASGHIEIDVSDSDLERSLREVLRKIVDSGFLKIR